MNLNEITELYFIAPIANVPSIVRHGILSHNLAGRIAHQTVAMPKIQERRENKKIPGARKLHEYANLYFDAHNPMLCKQKEKNYDICVLQVDVAILDLPGSLSLIVTQQLNGPDFRPWPRGLTQSIVIGCLPTTGLIPKIHWMNQDIKLKNALKS